MRNIYGNVYTAIQIAGQTKKKKAHQKVSLQQECS